MTLKLRPSRRTFMGSMIACMAAPTLPKIKMPELHFYTVSFGGAVTELFEYDFCEENDLCWRIVPAYSGDHAVKQMTAKIREAVRNQSRWGDEDEWDIKSHVSVSESEVVEAAKEWGIGFSDTASRLMAWRFEHDVLCEYCGLYSLDQLIPTCDQCYRCKHCVAAGREWREMYSSVDKKGACPDCHWI